MKISSPIETLRFRAKSEPTELPQGVGSAGAAEAGKSYDELPYPNEAYLDTHPSKAGAMGRLYGLAAAPADRCKVLELGCGGGANLQVMARDLPKSEFIGVDASAKQVAGGQKKAETLGLRNLHYLCQDFREFDPGGVRFDYIIAHGLFSWISPSMQQDLLERCQRWLAPHGIAYISYNAYPGWRMRTIFRDLMIYYSRDENTLLGKVKKARHFVEFLNESMVDKENPMSVYLNWEMAQMNACSDSYLAHEMLEPHNNPCYFYQFNHWAEEHGLQYLGDAQFGRYLLRHLPDELQAELKTLADDPVTLEQYVDFLVSRMFRKSLLCRKERRLSREPIGAMFATLSLGSFVRAGSPEPDLREGVTEEFSLEKTHLKTSRAMEKILFSQLAEAFPRTVPYRVIFRIIEERLGRAGEIDGEKLRAEFMDLVLFCHERDLVHLSTI